jgi:hypothetical protein
MERQAHALQLKLEAAEKLRHRPSKRRSDAADLSRLGWPGDLGPDLGVNHAAMILSQRTPKMDSEDWLRILSISPPTLDFKTIRVDTTAGPQIFTVTNTGRTATSRWPDRRPDYALVTGRGCLF